jgi:hypothetical protein
MGQQAQQRVETTVWGADQKAWVRKKACPVRLQLAYHGENAQAELRRSQLAARAEK